MQKITYKLTTISSLIVSPRTEGVFYIDKQEQGKPNVIYPFYQYGEYTEYKKETADYYLPGSTIKGALSQGYWRPNQKQGSETLNTPGLMVDDIRIPKNTIDLNTLWKGQYLELGQKACFESFMPNVGVEMLRAGVELTGDLYINEGDSIESALRSANKSTQRKMARMLERLENLREEKGLETQENTENIQKRELFYDNLNTIINNLSSLRCEENIILMGGYKGLLHSIDNGDSQSSGSRTPEPPKLEGGIYVDEKTKLPHGLVRIDFP